MDMKRDFALSSFPESPVQQQGQKIINEALEQFPIVIRPNVQLIKTPKHTNPGLEIVITQEGRSAFLSRGKLLLNKRRHVLLHNAEQPHQFIALADKSFCCTAIYIDRRLMESLAVCLDWINQIDVCQLELNPIGHSQFMNQCRGLEKRLYDKTAGWKQLAVAQLLQMAVFLEGFHNQHTRVVDARREEISSLVQQCVEYVCNHLEERLSLEQMARMFSISREHLTRSFTKQLGISFHQFVMGARVDYAKQLMLDDPELSVAEIALLSGFCAQSHFSKIFHSMTGCSPTQYRQRIKEVEEPSL
jgi:AraC-like DNA-binding protein